MSTSSKRVAAFAACVLAATITATITAAPLLGQRTTPLIKTHQSVPPEIVADLTANLRMTESARRTLIDDIVASTQADTGVLKRMAEQLHAARLTKADSTFVYDAVAAHVSRPIATNSFLSAATATGTVDRLYGSVELFSYRGKQLSVRFTSNNAVSDAKDSDSAAVGTAASAATFRLQTAELLATLQDGGPFSVQANWTPKAHQFDGSRFDFTMSAIASRRGVLGSTGGALGGVSGEMKWTAERTPTEVNPHPDSFTATLRLGARHSQDGIVTGLSTKTLGYGQIVLEGRPGGGKIPIGFAVTRVNRAFSKYAVGFQVFGVAGL